MSYIKFCQTTTTFAFDPKKEKELFRTLLPSIRNQVDLKEEQIKGVIEDPINFVKYFNDSKTLNSSEKIDVRVDYLDETTTEVLAMSEEAKKLPCSVPYSVCEIISI